MHHDACNTKQGSNITLAGGSRFKMSCASNWHVHIFLKLFDSKCLFKLQNPTSIPWMIKPTPLAGRSCTPCFLQLGKMYEHSRNMCAICLFLYVVVSFNRGSPNLPNRDETSHDILPATSSLPKQMCSLLHPSMILGFNTSQHLVHTFYIFI